MTEERVDETVRGVPAPPLRGLVGWYSGYRRRGLAPARHRGLPPLAFGREVPQRYPQHLDREFTALAGCPPSAWLAEEFRNIQAGHNPPG